MSEDRFYHAGFEQSKGIKGALLPLRRTLRRILRPMLVRLGDQLDSIMSRLDENEKQIECLHARHDQTVDQMQATIAFGWDYVAMTRRLAALEDQVARLQGERRETLLDDQLSLPFPDSSAA